MPLCAAERGDASASAPAGDPKSQIARCAPGRIRAARRDAIPVAIRVVTEKGPSAHRLAAGRVHKPRIAVCGLVMVGGREPVVAPFPDVAAGVVEAESIRLVAVDGHRRWQPAGGRLVWKSAAPD